MAIQRLGAVELYGSNATSSACWMAVAKSGVTATKSTAAGPISGNDVHHRSQVPCQAARERGIGITALTVITQERDKAGLSCRLHAVRSHADYRDYIVCKRRCIAAKL